MPTFMLDGEPLPYGGFTAGDVRHPASVLDNWSDEDLAEIGVERVADPEPEPPGLPVQVPMYKVRKYLIQNDMLDAVEAYLDGLSEPAKALALVDWEYAPNLVVNSALALGAKAALGLTDEQYADMVRDADALA